MKNPYIVGKSIYLRHPTLDDVEGVWHEWLSDPELTKYLSERYWPNSIESQREFFNSLQTSKNRLVLAVCDVKTDKHIGITSLNNINWVHGFAEIALIIGDKNYQSGLNAIETTSLLLKIAFTKLNLKNLLSKYISGHPITPLLLKRFGFREAGKLTNYLEIDNVMRDEVFNQLSRKEWLKKNSK